VHVCGEAYSDYQGFIEGALRSAARAIASIPE
jgi:monoamine oxidase